MWPPFCLTTSCKLTLTFVTTFRHKSSESARHIFTMWALSCLFLMKNMFNVTTVLPHNLLQTNPCIRHNFLTQVFRKHAAQLHYVGPELRYIFWPPFVKCFCNNKNVLRAQSMAWHFMRHPVCSHIHFISASGFEIIRILQSFSISAKSFMYHSDTHGLQEIYFITYIYFGKCYLRLYSELGSQRYITSSCKHFPNYYAQPQGF